MCANRGCCDIGLWNRCYALVDSSEKHPYQLLVVPRRGVAHHEAWWWLLEETSLIFSSFAVTSDFEPVMLESRLGSIRPLSPQVPFRYGFPSSSSSKPCAIETGFRECWLLRVKEEPRVGISQYRTLQTYIFHPPHEHIKTWCITPSHLLFFFLPFSRSPKNGFRVIVSSLRCMRAARCSNYQPWPPKRAQMLTLTFKRGSCIPTATLLLQS